LEIKEKQNQTGHRAYKLLQGVYEAIMQRLCNIKMPDIEKEEQKDDEMRF